MKNMNERWEHFRQTVIVTTVSPELMTAFKCAFFAGALSCMEAEQEIIKSISRCEPENMLEAIHNSAKQAQALHDEIWQTCEELGNTCPIVIDPKGHKMRNN